MPAQSNRGAVAPQSKQEARNSAEDSSSERAQQEKTDKALEQERRGPVAVRGDIPPAGVLEDSSMAAEAKAEAKKAGKEDSPGVVQDIVLPPHSGNYAEGLKREVSVLSDPLTGATVVLSDRVKSPFTLETLEVLTEPVEEEQAREDLEEEISALASRQQEAESKER